MGVGGVGRGRGCGRQRVCNQVEDTKTTTTTAPTPYYYYYYDHPRQQTKIFMSRNSTGKHGRNLQRRETELPSKKPSVIYHVSHWPSNHHQPPSISYQKILLNQPPFQPNATSTSSRQPNQSKWITREWRRMWWWSANAQHIEEKDENREENEWICTFIQHPGNTRNDQSCRFSGISGGEDAYTDNLTRKTSAL